MATIEQLVERIETRLFLAAGMDVQTHAEDQIMEMLRGVYTTLFDDFWYPEYTFYTQQDVLASTGEITGDISSLVLRYKDLHSVFWDECDDALPRFVPGVAPSRIRTRGITPSPNAGKIFTVLPLDEDGPVHIWYRKRIADEVWDDQIITTDIPFDDEVLMYGVVYEFLVMDASNQLATGEYKSKYQGRQQQMRNAQWQIPLSKRSLDRDGPATRWR